MKPPRLPRIVRADGKKMILTSAERREIMRKGGFGRRDPKGGKK